MARYIPGAAGEFNGSMGTTTMYRWRRLKIGRSKPGKTSKKPSPDQKKHRSRLGLISRHLSRFKEVVKYGFPSQRLNMTSMNVAVKENFHTAITGKFPKLKIENSLLKLSKGTLDNVHRPRLVQHENGVVAVEWVNPERLKIGVEEHDVVHLVFYSEVLRLRQLRHRYDLALRRDAFADVTNPVSYMKGSVHVWIFMVSDDGKRPSSSIYLGAIDSAPSKSST